MDLPTLINWVTTHPNTDLNIILGSGALSLILEKLLTQYHVNSKKLAFTSLHVIGIVTAGLATLLAHLQGLAPAGLYASIVVFAGIWHRFMISGIYDKEIEPVLNDLASQPAPAAEPAVPAPGTTVVGNDISSQTLAPAAPQK